MTPDDALVTSPLFFVQPGPGSAVIAVDLVRGGRFKALAPEVLDLASFFLEPGCAGDAVEAGYSLIVVAAALDAGVLVAAGTTAFAAAHLWENYRWSRAAYLLFSQQDLVYTEPTERNYLHADLVALRRQTILGFLEDQPYPPLRLAQAIEPPGAQGVITLSAPPQEAAGALIDLDALFRRRSIRSYAEHVITLRTFASILHATTRNVRIANASKGTGDPLFLLNSFYSWLHLYVVVQGVEGLRRGVYQYDSETHQMRCVAIDTSDAEVLRCIQYQDWIGGGGFCTFFVVQWNRYQWLYRHSRAYVNLLIQLGEIGQELLQAVYAHGLGAWPTPAIHESNAARLLHLDELGEEAMYFVKVGPPAPRQS